MRYTIEFRKEAQNDIVEAINWYEEKKMGLGNELFVAIENEKRLIETNPYFYEEKYKGIRKAITRRFPYVIYYKDRKR